MAVTKKEIVKKIADEMGITQTAAKGMFDTFFEELADLLVAGESFTEIGFGTFYTEEQAPRNGFNPSTKKKMILPRRIKLHFRPSDVVKEAVNAQ